MCSGETVMRYNAESKTDAILSGAFGNIIGANDCLLVNAHQSISW